MRLAIHVRSRATRDVINHAVYISLRHAGAGRYFPVAVDQTYALLSEYPIIGSPEPAGAKSLQKLRNYGVIGFLNFRICYLPKRNRIEIVRVLHASQDRRRIFKVK